MDNRSILIRRKDHEQLLGSLDMLIATRESTYDRWHLGKLREALKRSRVVDQLPANPQVITIGSTVRIVKLFNDEEFVYTLVMPGREDIAQGKLSVTEPLGAALLGRQEGDVVRLAPNVDDFSVKIAEVIAHPVQLTVGADRRLIPMLYSQVTGCPTELIEFYVSLFSGKQEVSAVPLHLGNIDLDPDEFTLSMEAVLDQLKGEHDCPTMLIEWQWHPNMPLLIALLHKRKQQAIFIKPGGARRIGGVTALISGSRHSIANLEIAAAFARHLGVEVGAIKVIDPAWIGLEGDRARGDYLAVVKTATENHLRRVGLDAPVRVVFDNNMADEIIQTTAHDEMLVMGCPNDLLIHNGFTQSAAGQIMSRFKGTVLMRLPGGSEELNLSDVFWEATIVRDLDAPDKWTAIEQMVDALSRAGQVPADHREQILRAIQMRELDGTTHVGNGIAMPHAAIDDFSGLVGCLGISPKGIRYEENAEPVHFVFLLVSSKRDYTKYHQIQSAIAQFMTRQAALRRERLLQSETPAEVARLLGAKR